MSLSESVTETTLPSLAEMFNSSSLPTLDAATFAPEIETHWGAYEETTVTDSRGRAMDNRFNLAMELSVKTNFHLAYTVVTKAQRWANGRPEEDLLTFRKTNRAYRCGYGYGFKAPLLVSTYTTNELTDKGNVCSKNRETLSALKKGASDPCACTTRDYYSLSRREAALLAGHETQKTRQWLENRGLDLATATMASALIVRRLHEEELLFRGHATLTVAREGKEPLEIVQARKESLQSWLREPWNYIEQVLVPLDGLMERGTVRKAGGHYAMDELLSYGEREGLMDEARKRRGPIK